MYITFAYFVSFVFEDLFAVDLQIGHLNCLTKFQSDSPKKLR